MERLSLVYSEYSLVVLIAVYNWGVFADDDVIVTDDRLAIFVPRDISVSCTCKLQWLRIRHPYWVDDRSDLY